MLWGMTKERKEPDKSSENKDQRPEKLEGAHGGFEINKGNACQGTLNGHEGSVTES